MDYIFDQNNKIYLKPFNNQNKVFFSKNNLNLSNYNNSLKKFYINKYLEYKFNDKNKNNFVKFDKINYCPIKFSKNFIDKKIFFQMNKKFIKISNIIKVENIKKIINIKKIELINIINLYSNYLIYIKNCKNC